MSKNNSSIFLNIPISQVTFISSASYITDVSKQLHRYKQENNRISYGKLPMETIQIAVNQL